MGLISRVTKRVEVPGEPDAWLDIQQLSWLTLDKAKKERLKEIGGMREAFAGLREVLAQNGAEKVVADAKSAADADPYSSYDPLTVLKHGIVAWSYGEKVTPEDFTQETATWAVREILAYTLPGEAETKKPSSPSIVT